MDGIRWPRRELRCRRNGGVAEKVIFGARAPSRAEVRAFAEFAQISPKLIRQQTPHALRGGAKGGTRGRRALQLNCTCRAALTRLQTRQRSRAAAELIRLN